MKEWLTPTELAEMKCLGLPATRRGIDKLGSRNHWKTRRNMAGEPLARRRKGHGGGWEYHYTVLPQPAQTKLVADSNKNVAAKPIVIGRGEQWAWFDRQTDKRKQTANQRLTILVAVAALEKGGMGKDLAIYYAACDSKVSKATIYNWFNLVAGIERADWLPALCPRHAGRTATKSCTAKAWEMIKGDYLRSSRPTFTSCYRNLEDAATEHGWTIPGSAALWRRMEREIIPPVMMLARHGAEAAARMFPAQERDRSCFHAMEAVNADGHTFDVFIKWPNGEVGRVCMVAFQDLYSGKIVSWRIDRSENKEAVRLAFGDMVDTYGIPSHAYLDNGRAFASKWLTGGVANRYRFKIKEEDPTGIISNLGVEIHWTTPYNGQAKPIERAFKDFCNDIAKHPALDGAWTGNNPLNKPADYGSKAIPIEDFIKVVTNGIAKHNARPGRTAKICAGRSFDDTFNESYAKSPIRKTTKEQRRLWLLAAEGVMATRPDGAIRLLGNRYWDQALHQVIGQKMVVRFDPDNLHDGVHVYRLDGSYFGYAECIEAAGFNDVTAARQHNRARRSWLNAQKDALKAMRTLDPAAVAAMLPQSDEDSPPESKVVRMVTERPVIATKMAKQGPVPLTEEEQDAADTMWRKLTGDGGAEIIPLPTTNTGERPAFETDEAFARWMLANPDQMDDQDNAYLDDLLSSSSFRLLIDYEEKRESRGA